MEVVFTDLDGTLLDTQTYSFEAARPALERLRRTARPLVFTTSKTRAEVELWRRRTTNRHPFIFENGAAVAIPPGYFPFPAPERIEFGAPYSALVQALERAERRSGCRVRSFHHMSAGEVAAACGLPLDQAVLAKQREFDEPFEVLEGCVEKLTQALEAQGLRWTRGGRFHHVLGASDKARAVTELTALYRRAYRDVRTIGLGDGWNDLDFLRVVDLPVIIASPHSAELAAALPRARVTETPAPEGWNHVLLEMIPE